MAYFTTGLEKTKIALWFLLINRDFLDRLSRFLWVEVAIGRNH
jgi:hypothetical protein